MSDDTDHEWEQRSVPACPRCAALESEARRLREERSRASEPHAALMGGWLSRNGGAALSDNPHPAGSLRGDWWEKGWQWREDTLACDAVRTQFAELAAAVRIREAGVSDTRLWNEAGARIRELLRRAEGEAK